MDYAALAVIALLIAASACWPLLRASGKRRKALNAQALQLPEHHRPRYRQSLAGNPLAFPLAMSSGYALCRGADLDEFLFPDAEEERIILAESWGIFNDGDAVQELWSLLSLGHRSGWQQSRKLVNAGGAALAQQRKVLVSRARISEEAREELLSLRRLQRNERGVQELDFLAWDLSRAVMVARSAATCGFLDQRVAQDVALQAASYAQQTYGSRKHSITHAGSGARNKTVPWTMPTTHIERRCSPALRALSHKWISTHQYRPASCCSSKPRRNWDCRCTPTRRIGAGSVR